MAITRLVLSGLKAHRGRVELPLRSVNIFAGANSSGKSTALQALLLVRQSYDPFMEFSGLRTQGGIDLGEPACLVSRGIDPPQCSIELDVSVPANPGSFRFVSRLGGDTKRLELIGLQFNALTFRIEESLLPNLVGLLSEDGETVLRLRGLFVVEELRRTRGIFPDELKSEFTAQFSKTASQILLSCIDILPKGTETERRVCEQAKTAVDAKDWRLLNAFLDNFRQSVLISESVAELRKVTGRLRSLNAIDIDLLESLLFAARFSELDLDVFELLEEMLSKGASVGIGEFMASDQGIARRYNSSLAAYAAALRYVGPVRQAPQSVYPYTGASRAQDVLPDGTGLVPLLALAWSSRSGLRTPEGTGCTVGEALAAWYRFLGIAQSLSIEELPGIGFQLKVVVTGSVWDTVRNVGVGVTQILPIVGQLALMSVGDTLLIEQPELHLHPSVAVRLGELVAAAGRDGLQVVVETHSEHFVNGVRLGVAEGVLPSTSVFVGFFEESSQTDRSIRVRQLAVDASGFMSEWPHGFFDQSEEISIKLIKRKSRKAS